MSPAEIEEHIDLLTAVAEIVDPVPGEPVVRNDPHDDPVVYTAVAGRADVLCTLDRDFYDPGVVEFFRAEHCDYGRRRVAPVCCKGRVARRCRSSHWPGARTLPGGRRSAGAQIEASRVRGIAGHAEVDMTAEYTFVAPNGRTS